MQNDYSKEDCVVYSITGSCYKCATKKKCGILKLIRDQRDDMTCRWIVGGVIVGLWVLSMLFS